MGQSPSFLIMKRMVSVIYTVFDDGGQEDKEQLYSHDRTLSEALVYVIVTDRQENTYLPILNSYMVYFVTCQIKHYILVTTGGLGYRYDSLRKLKWTNYVHC
jgi:hypothetical protein